MRAPIKVFRFLLASAALFTLPGCMWITGATAALVGSSSNDGGSKKEPPPPEPAVLAAERSPGPFQLLDGEGMDLAIGDLVPESGDTDVAVLFRDPPGVKVFRGDGTGRLWEHSSLRLRGDHPLSLAVVPAVDGGTGALLVLTTNTLELFHWAPGVSSPPEAEAGWQHADPLRLSEATRRDLAIGDFDGDQAPDAAVSSFEQRTVTSFGIAPESPDPFAIIETLHLASPPVSLAASDFVPDPQLRPEIGTGRSDLLVMVQQGGDTAVLLHVTEPSGKWCPDPDATWQLPDRGIALAKPPYGKSQDLDDDGLGDAALIRLDGTSTLFVKPCQEDCLGACGRGAWELSVQSRGGGHFSPLAAAIALVRLPGGNAATWDRITVDARLNSVICSYFRPRGRDIALTVSYPLPGTGRALAVGDLNRDIQDDLIVLTTKGDRSTLTTLLANPEAEELRDHPFYYPFASTAGEAPKADASLLDVAFGHAGKRQDKPFLAAVDRNNEELAVFYLDPETAAWLPPEERYGGLGTRPGSVAVADFDGDGDDDIVVGAGDGLHFLRNDRDQGPRFTWEPHSFAELLVQDPNHAAWRRDDDDTLRSRISAEFPSLLLRDLAVGHLDEALVPDPGHLGVLAPDRGQLDRAPLPDLAQLDAVPVPDLVIPIETENETDSVLVILNPGLEESPAFQVKLFRTLDNPRVVSLGNLNDDVAPDLIVACDQAKAIHLLFGNPESPGAFFDEETDPLPPKELPGIEGEVEEAHSNASPFTASRVHSRDPWPLVEWIVASNESTVSVYPFLGLEPAASGPGFLPQFGEACDLFTASKDPEAILVADLFEDDAADPLLDLAVVDEAGAGNVILLSNTGKTQSPCDLARWKNTLEPLPVGSPQRVVPFRLGAALFLAVASRSEQRVVIFRRDCKGMACAFSEVEQIALPEANVLGSRLGMASAPSADGGLLVALLAEDADGGPDAAAVDLLSFTEPKEPGGTEDLLLKLGSLASSVCAPRLSLTGAALTPAILLGEPGGTGTAPGLLAYEPRALTGDVHRHDLSMQDPFCPTLSPEWKPFLQGLDPLTDWRLVSGASRQTVALATENGLAMWLGPQNLKKLPMPDCPDPCGIVRIAWLDGDRYLATMKEAQIAVRSTLDGNPVFHWEGQAFACVGAGDVNGDGRDDLAVVDGVTSTLHVFLATGRGPQLSFAEEPRSFPFPITEPVDLAFLHANRDGGNQQHLDICVAVLTGEVFVFLGNGAGDFSEPGTLYAGPEIEALTVADLNDDGLDEILVSTNMPGLVVLSSGGTR